MAFINTTAAAPGVYTSFWTRLTQVPALRRQRRQLAQLDSAALQDMGLTASDVAAELKRSVWDVPAHWRG